ncbi:hypothetical protein IX299_000153 [Porphyromonas levii]|nr:hypothetical protein [Porphyromonas levii]
MCSRLTAKVAATNSVTSKWGIVAYDSTEEKKIKFKDLDLLFA